jgi:hypothetical protein
VPKAIMALLRYRRADQSRAEGTGSPDMPPLRHGNPVNGEAWGYPRNRREKPVPVLGAAYRGDR